MHPMGERGQARFVTSPAEASKGWTSTVSRQPASSRDIIFLKVFANVKAWSSLKATPFVFIGNIPPVVSTASTAVPTICQGDAEVKAAASAALTKFMKVDEKIRKNLQPQKFIHLYGMVEFHPCMVDFYGFHVNSEISPWLPGIFSYMNGWFLWSISR